MPDIVTPEELKKFWLFLSQSDGIYYNHNGDGYVQTYALHNKRLVGIDIFVWGLIKVALNGIVEYREMQNLRYDLQTDIDAIARVIKQLYGYDFKAEEIKDYES